MNTAAKDTEKILTDVTAHNQVTMDTMPNISDNMAKSGPGSIDVDLSNSAQTLQAAATQYQQKTIWTGLLEFTEKQKPGDAVTRTVRSMPAQLTACFNDPDIDTSKWRDILSMSFIPKTVMTPLLTPIKDIRIATFLFTPNDPDTMTSLERHLSSYVGCMCLQQLPANLREARVMLMIYHSRRRQFFGLIPKDETLFLIGLRCTLIRNQLYQPPSQASLMMNSQQQQLPLMMPGLSTQMKCDVSPQQPMDPRVVPLSVTGAQQAPSGFTMPNISDSVAKSGPGSVGVDLNNPSQTLQVAAMQQHQRTIWTGLLEFTEKQKPGDTVTRTVRSIPAQLTASVNDRDINTSKYKDRLVVSFIPKAVMTSLLTLIKDSRTATFILTPNDPDSITSLQRHLSGHFGCICVQKLPASPREVRVMLMIYNSRKRQFFGLIPNDEARFLSGLKSVVNKHKMREDKILENAFGALSIQPVMFTSSAQEQQQLCQQQSSFAPVPQAPSQNVQPGLQPPCTVPQMQQGQNFGQLSCEMESDFS